MIKNGIVRLREEERNISKKVIRIIKNIHPQAEAIYIPNIEPNNKVNYLFITMEPSFKHGQELKEMQ